MHIHASAGDDDIAFAANESKAAVFGFFSEVAGSEPLAFALVHRSALPRGVGQHVSADEDFAFIAETNFAARESSTDGSFCDFEGVVEGYERSGLDHTVALDERDADGVPEVLQLLWQCRATGDDGPELPSEGAVDLAESPPLFRDRWLFRRVFQLCGERIETAEQVASQQLQDARYGNEHGDAFATDQLGQSACFDLFDKMHFAGKE